MTHLPQSQQQAAAQAMADELQRHMTARGIAQGGARIVAVARRPSA